MVAVSPRLPYQMPAPDNEDVYSLSAVGIKRSFFGECDVMSTGAVGASMYAVGGGSQSLKQSRLMMSHSQQTSSQNLAPEQQQQSMMHWTSSAAVTNGQIIPPSAIAGGKMTQMSPLRPQQPLPNQTATPPSHLGSVAIQPPSSAEVEMVLSARRSIADEMEVFFYLFFTFLQAYVVLIKTAGLTWLDVCFAPPSLQIMLLCRIDFMLLNF